MVAIVVGACSTEHSLDREALEREIRETLVPSRAGLVTDVACPAIADPAPGMAFSCTAQLGEQQIPVDVDLTGTEDELTSRASVPVRLVATDEIAALLASTFGEEIGIPTAVDCGQAVRALPEGDEVVCEATDPSGVVRRFAVAIGQDGALELTLR